MDGDQNKAVIEVQTLTSSTHKALKRNRAAKYAAYLTAFSAKSKKINAKKKGIVDVNRLNRRWYGHLVDCCSGKFVVMNYKNFRRSALPCRVMFFSNGAWTDFSSSVTDTLKDFFKNQKSVSEVSIGASLYVFDFLRMIQLDLERGSQRSIAWIDVKGNCFFPKLCIEDGGFQGNEMNGISPDVKGSKSDMCTKKDNEAMPDPELKAKPEAIVQKTDPAHMLYVNGAEKGEGSGVDDGSVSDGSTDVSEPLISDISSIEHTFQDLNRRLTRLTTQNVEYAAVRSKFFAGFGATGKDTSIVAIYRCFPLGPLGRDYLKFFQGTSEIMKKHRGDANVRMGWHGTSKEGICSIMSHGFGYSNVARSAPYGVGVYLASDNHSYVGAAYSDVDENGEQHVMLCRVILGNTEVIKFGSRQCYPSNEKFDTGVDNFSNPSQYVIWGSHMNTHILPQYIVSFKVKSHVKEQWSQWKTNTQRILKNIDGEVVNGNRYRLGGYMNISKKNEISLCNNGNINEMENTEIHVSSPNTHSVSSKGSMNDISDTSEASIKVPKSPWLPFPKLFSIIEKDLPKASIDLLQYHHSKFKERKLPREKLIKIAREIVGDERLIQAIKSIKNETQRSTTSIVAQGLQRNSTTTPVRMVIITIDRVFI